MEMLTVNQAVEQGYEYCTPYYEEMKLIPISECDFKRRYVLVEKETKPFQISDSLLADLLNDYLTDQDDVADEDGHLNDIAAEVDLTAATEALNRAFSKTKYYYPSDILLTL